MIFCIPFQMSHLKAFKSIEEQTLGIPRERLELAAAFNGGLTFVSDGRVIASFGGVTTGTRSEVWANVNPTITTKETRHILRVMKFFVEDTLKRGIITRLSATVHVSFKRSHRLMEFLGFEKEGIMKNYHANEDFILYSRTKWG